MTHQAADYQGDRPLGNGDEDRLGYKLTAERRAKSLIEQSPKQGLVIGLEGRWGAGKSSLLHLLIDELNGLDSSVRPAVVRFEPWLVGDRDSLLSTLFSDLAAAVEQIAPSRPVKKAAKAADTVAEKIRTFGAGLSGAGKAARLAGLFVPGASFAAEVLEAIVAASDELKTNTPLATRKAEISAELGKLDRHIVVAIDDIDRLEPAEAVEVLRLVRSVADFPNVLYVICYDDRVLSKAIQSAAAVSDGRAYSEKIVQVVVPVPVPEPFDLRQWFRRDLAKFVDLSSFEQSSHLDRAIDVEGGTRLTTPRAVVRALNGLRFAWPALRNEVDLGDLVWLHLIKAHDLRLYRWIEEYCGNCSVVQNGLGQVGSKESARSFRKLEKLLAKAGTSYEEAQLSLVEYLPGLTYTFDKAEPKLFERMTEKQVSVAVSGRRLASPDHYRLYFALSAPANAPRQGHFDAFRHALADSAGAVEQVIAEWMSIPYSTQSSLAEVMFDRLQSDVLSDLPPAEAIRACRALANTLDIKVPDIVEDWGRPGIWSVAIKLLTRLLDRVPLTQRSSTLAAMFRRGSAIEWLTSILRDQMFAHGLVGDRAVRGGEFLSLDEVEIARREMLSRFRKLTATDYRSLARPLNLLFAWYQGGDEIGPRTLLGQASAADEDFLSVLDGLAVEVSSSNGNYRKLSKENLRYFLDYDATKQRVELLAKKGPASRRATAKRILGYFLAEAY